MNLTQAIAFFLPQYHPIPENDAWWGKGFTEWTNVCKERPRFRGHYQPHLPADLGYYDLRLPEVRQLQANLAKENGISGFCYYHYWFNKRRLLERPMNEVLKSGEPDFPFSLCWANGNWNRNWDGGNVKLLLEQNYSFSDDLDHIRYLCPIFADQRYIRVSGKPLFLVYQASSLPDPKKTTEIWRNEAIKQGIGELFLCRVESFHTEQVDPTKIGFDAAVEFAPDWSCTGELLGRGRFRKLVSMVNPHKRSFFSDRVFSYDQLAQRMLAKPQVSYPRYRCVTPMWDNSARRKNGATIFVGSTPAKYEFWLTEIAKSAGTDSSHEPLIFINAWNEWAEGNHLEPCIKWGNQYLKATQTALRSAASTIA